MSPRAQAALLVLATACTDEPAPTPADCAAGFTRGADDNCYPDEVEDTEETEEEDEAAPPTMDEVLAAMGDCTPLPAGEALDLAAGCAHGLCTETTYAEAVAAAGEPVSCETFRYESGTYVSGGIDCVWDNGVELDWDDDDLDGIADEGSWSYGVTLGPDTPGASPEGIGVGASVACLLDIIGRPETVWATHDGRTWSVEMISYYEAGITASDFYNAETGGYAPDGRIDMLFLYGGYEPGEL